MFHTKINTLIDLALEEDAAFGDVTSQSIFPRDHQSRANILARENMVICGLEVAKRVFHRIDPALNVQHDASDGDQVSKGSSVLRIEGPTISLLMAERTALNFLQRLSGIASLSRQYADAAEKANTGVRIVDTRKTTPGWRALEKYAVRCGGCVNHRSSLGEHVLIKENHIMAAGTLTKAVELARKHAPHCAKIEVETESLDQVSEALEAGAEVIMLDNMSPQQIQQAIDLVNKAAIIEISGGVTLKSIPEYALPGVDVISVGALTHSAPAADFSMIVSGDTTQ
ncbi:MAG: carboxylating nicotinate-nucleotide diphosphorylase [Gammaproteobacteria bacterium]|nr:carboxylating nicotinate-nucleotide diphosphorylase [Gammaproteobacteria bacterium]